MNVDKIVEAVKAGNVGEYTSDWQARNIAAAVIAAIRDIPPESLIPERITPGPYSTQLYGLGDPNKIAIATTAWTAMCDKLCEEFGEGA